MTWGGFIGYYKPGYHPRNKLGENPSETAELDSQPLVQPSFTDLVDVNGYLINDLMVWMDDVAKRHELDDDSYKPSGVELDENGFKWYVDDGTGNLKRIIPQNCNVVYGSGVDGSGIALTSSILESGRKWDDQSRDNYCELIGYGWDDRDFWERMRRNYYYILQKTQTVQTFYTSGNPDLPVENSFDYWGVDYLSIGYASTQGTNPETWIQVPINATGVSTLDSGDYGYFGDFGKLRKTDLYGYRRTDLDGNSNIWWPYNGTLDNFPQIGEWTHVKIHSEKTFVDAVKYPFEVNEDSLTYYLKDTNNNGISEFVEESYYQEHKNQGRFLNYRTVFEDITDTWRDKNNPPGFNGYANHEDGLTYSGVYENRYGFNSNEDSEKPKESNSGPDIMEASADYYYPALTTHAIPPVQPFPNSRFPTSYNGIFKSTTPILDVPQVPEYGAGAMKYREGAVLDYLPSGLECSSPVTIPIQFVFTPTEYHVATKFPFTAYNADREDFPPLTLSEVRVFQDNSIFDVITPALYSNNETTNKNQIRADLRAENPVSQVYDFSIKPTITKVPFESYQTTISTIDGGVVHTAINDFGEESFIVNTWFTILEPLSSTWASEEPELDPEDEKSWFTHAQVDTINSYFTKSLGDVDTSVIYDKKPYNNRDYFVFSDDYEDEVGTSIFYNPYGLTISTNPVPKLFNGDVLVHTGPDYSNCHWELKPQHENQVDPYYESGITGEELDEDLSFSAEYRSETGSLSNVNNLVGYEINYYPRFYNCLKGRDNGEKVAIPSGYDVGDIDSENLNRAMSGNKIHYNSSGISGGEHNEFEFAVDYYATKNIRFKYSSDILYSGNSLVNKYGVRPYGYPYPESGNLKEHPYTMEINLSSEGTPYIYNERISENGHIVINDMSEELITSSFKIAYGFIDLDDFPIFSGVSIDEFGVFRNEYYALNSGEFINSEGITIPTDTYVEKANDLYGYDVSRRIVEMIQSGDIIELESVSDYEHTHIDRDRNINWGTNRNLEIDISEFMRAKCPYSNGMIFMVQYIDPIYGESKAPNPWWKQTWNSTEEEKTGHAMHFSNYLTVRSPSVLTLDGGPMKKAEYVRSGEVLETGVSNGLYYAGKVYVSGEYQERYEAVACFDDSNLSVGTPAGYYYDINLWGGTEYNSYYASEDWVHSDNPLNNYEPPDENDSFIIFIEKSFPTFGEEIFIGRSIIDEDYPSTPVIPLETGVR